MKKLIFVVLNLLALVAEDFFILSGLGVIIYTTYSINQLAGNYLLGFVLLFLGLLIARKQKRKGGV